MWQETDMQKAVKAAAKGREVRVAVPDGDDAYRLISLEKYFKDCRFLIGVVAVLNPEFEEAVQQADPTTSKTGPGDRPVMDSPTKRAKVDTGKLLALHEAGWSNKKIAEELRVSDVTFGNYLKKLKEENHEKD